MKTPLQWQFDLSDALEAHDIVVAVMRNGRKLNQQRHELRHAANELHELLESFEANGLTDEYEKQYLCIFDALSFLNTAMRSFHVRVDLLARCREELLKLQAMGGEQ